ncbi:MAG TPA: type II toxin-antitoxin system VapC family toxin [Bryobacteraceae bacterium]|nr:type II toxin-antitoxin system VapC family toxin [Bryobacteraceae bacterium]
MNGRREYVLDSTALLALVFRETGWEKVVDLAPRSSIGAVNLTETIHKLIHRGSSAHAAEDLLQKMELDVVDWSEDLAYRSAEFAMFGRSHGLSLGDRACLALAKHLHATAVTSDRAWREIRGLGVPVLMFR